jgi:Flp pilus assembly protein TadB
MSVLECWATLSPVSAEPSDDLQEALAFLGKPVDAATVVDAGYGLGTAGGAVTLALWIAVPGGLPLPALLALVALVTAGIHAVHALPRALARARETRALGEAPDLVSRAVLSMRLSPSTEQAAEFAAETSDGPLARSLGANVRRAELGGSDALVTFAEQWEGRFPDFGRALTLVSAAGRMQPRDRERTLDRALSTVLEGTRSEMADFAGRIRRPVTALYAFGVLLPTALVALLPAAGAAGIGVTIATVVVFYDVLLPGGLTIAGVWLVANRPVAFPPPTVDRSHPDVPAGAERSVLAGGVVGATGWLLVGSYLPPWGAPFLALSLGLGVGLWHYYQPVVAVYEQVETVEDGLTDALSLVGRHVANGKAVEAAVEQTAEDLEGEIASVFETAAAQQRQLNASVEEAFLGENGALSDLPSPRARGTIAVLSLAATEGKPVGEALLGIAEHVDDLGAVEAAARRDLDAVCGTLETTGAAFGPMVAGSTVALADGIASGGSGMSVGGSMPGLGFAIGGYVVATAVLLPALSTTLGRGFDRALVGVAAGRSLALAAVVYPFSYVLVSGLV